MALALLLTFTAAAGLVLRPGHIKAAVIRGLTQKLNLDVDLQDVSVSLWPRPRVTGHGLTVRLPNQSDLPPFIVIDHFWMDVGPLSMLRQHVERVHVGGLKVAVPPAGTREALAVSEQRGRTHIIVDELVSHDAELRILRRDPNDVPLMFAIHDLVVRDIGFHNSMPFTATLTNPVPRGLVHASGTVGPWHKDDAPLMPVSGVYTFTDADLSTINGIGGTLQSTGRFNGQLVRIDVTGDAQIPNFNLDLGGRPAPLTCTFEVAVDGTNGTTILTRVDATLGSTSMEVSGAITNLPGPGQHLVELDVNVPAGRIEDLVALAIDAPTPIMAGVVTLRTRLNLPPGPRRVQTRLSLAGAFDLRELTFADATVHTRILELSRRSRANGRADPSRVLADVRGQFELRSGVLSLPRLTFAVPGAHVSLHGTYQLASTTLDFQGTLRMETTASRAMGGFKAIFIKPFDPVFRKQGAGAVLPIKITGQRKEPKFGLEVKRIFGRADSPRARR